MKGEVRQTLCRSVGTIPRRRSSATFASLHPLSIRRDVDAATRHSLLGHRPGRAALPVIKDDARGSYCQEATWRSASSPLEVGATVAWRPDAGVGGRPEGKALRTKGLPERWLEGRARHDYDDEDDEDDEDDDHGDDDDDDGDGDDDRCLDDLCMRRTLLRERILARTYGRATSVRDNEGRACRDLRQDDDYDDHREKLGRPSPASSAPRLPRPTFLAFARGPSAEATKKLQHNGSRLSEELRFDRFPRYRVWPIENSQRRTGVKILEGFSSCLIQLERERNSIENFGAPKKLRGDVSFDIGVGDNEKRRSGVTCLLGRILICNDALSPPVLSRLPEESPGKSWKAEEARPRDSDNQGS
ncbi:hypothetical protein KM043_000732 [Ampulex compressa]|nr:hypothetical protein KM043_000732 [Ampulex compressa]